MPPVASRSARNPRSFADCERHRPQSSVLRLLGLSQSVRSLFWPTLGSTLSSVSRRTPTPSASNWPRYLPRKLVGGGEAASPSDRRKQWPVHATLRAPRARGASRCMRGAENLVLQEGQAARRDLTRALKAGPPGEGAERSHRLFVLPGGQPGPPSVPGAPDTRCLLRRFPVQV